MARRTLWLEVTAERSLVWPDGRLELPDDLAEQLAAMAPMTEVEVSGRYERLGRHDAVVFVDGLEVKGTPLERARAAWRLTLRRASDLDHQRALLARLLVALRDDPSPGARALRACVEAETAPAEASRDALVALLGDPAAPAEELELELAHLFDRASGWDALSKEARRAVFGHAWTRVVTSPTSGRWRAGFVPAVVDAHLVLAPRSRVPIHFGGPTPELAPRVVGEWLDGTFDAVADPEDRRALDGLRAGTTADQQRFLSAVQRQSDRLNDDASRRAHAEHARYGDPLDSPPDGVGIEDDPTDRLASHYARLRVALGGEDAHLESGAVATLVRRLNRRGGAHAFVMALEAVVIASALDGELARAIDAVPFAWIGTERVAVLVRASRRGGLLLADGGRTGSWRLSTGPLLELVDRLPAEQREAARAALERPDTTLGPGSLALSPSQDRYAPPSVVELAAERWVEHSRFGRGRVVGVVEGPRGNKLDVDFVDHGLKQLHERFLEDA